MMPLACSTHDLLIALPMLVPVVGLGGFLIVLTARERRRERREGV